MSCDRRIVSVLYVSVLGEAASSLAGHYERSIAMPLLVEQRAIEPGLFDSRSTGKNRLVCIKPDGWVLWRRFWWDLEVF